MEESWRGADHTQTSWGAADRCHESTAVIHTARMEGGEEGAEREEGGGWVGGEERHRQRNGRRKVKERKGGKEGCGNGGKCNKSETVVGCRRCGSM